MNGTRTLVTMHLHSGIPVVDIQGDWNETTDSLLSETVDHLTLAGHFEIIVNMSQMVRVPTQEHGWQEGLERMATAIRKRFGRLDVVASLEQVASTARRQAHSFVRWATSEEEAICHINGIPRATRGLIVSSKVV